AAITLQSCLPAFEDTVILIGCRAHRRVPPQLRPTTTVQVEVPPFGDRIALWRKHLGSEAGGEGALTEIDLARIASTYNLGVSGIVRATARARETAAFARAPLSRAMVQEAVRGLFDSDLASIGRRVEVSQCWDDLVLPDDLMRSVCSILDRVTHR